MSQGIGKWSGMPFPSLVIGFHSAKVRQDKRWVALGWFLMHLWEPVAWGPFLGDIYQNLESLTIEFPYIVCKQLAKEKNRANNEGDYWNTQQKHRATQVNSSCTPLPQEEWVPPSRTTADISFSRCFYLWKQSVIIHSGHDSPRGLVAWTMPTIISSMLAGVRWEIKLKTLMRWR